MRAHRLKKIIVGTIVIIAGIIFARTIVLAFFYYPESGPPDTGIAVGGGGSNASSSADLPARLIIPSLHIDAPVEYVGVNAAGNMRAPSNFTDVAWYDRGTVPGTQGSAVMDGHVDNGLGLPGVFKNLATLQPGADIYVAVKSGARLHFVVATIASYPYTAAPSDVIFGQTDAARLNLITCEGTWVPGGDTYDHRLVVFAVRR